MLWRTVSCWPAKLAINFYWWVIEITIFLPKMRDLCLKNSRYKYGTVITCSESLCCVFCGTDDANSLHYNSLAQLLARKQTQLCSKSTKQSWQTDTWHKTLLCKELAAHFTDQVEIWHQMKIIASRIFQKKKKKEDGPKVASTPNQCLILILCWFFFLILCICRYISI